MDYYCELPALIHGLLMRDPGRFQRLPMRASGRYPLTTNRKRPALIHGLLMRAPGPIQRLLMKAPGPYPWSTNYNSRPLSMDY